MYRVPGLTVVGTPLGADDDVRRQLQDIYDDAGRLLRSIVLRLRDHQIMFLLIRCCVVTKVTHLLRVSLPHLVRDISDAFDPSVDWEGEAWVSAATSLDGLGSYDCP